jgi:hypothetical protein
MSNELFPQLDGLHWEVKLTDEFSNLIQKAAAPGFETRLSLGPDPLIHFDLSYNWFRQLSYGAVIDELSKLRGFFRARKADFDSFLLSLPDVTENEDDGSIAEQVLTPDGNLIAPLIVTREGYDENIYEAAGVNGDPGTAPAISFDGGTPLVAGTDYNLVGPGFALAGVTYPGLAVQFLTDPTGHVATADFSWYYRVRFAQSEQQFDKFLALLYSAQKVELVTTRTQ